MDYKQAADILDPATSREALLPYAYDPQYQKMLLRDACQVAAGVLRGVPDTNVGDKWISVKDRLPKKQGYYLVCCFLGKGTLYEEQSIDLIYFRGKQHWAKREKYITHWTYLPKPPVKGATKNTHIKIQYRGEELTLREICERLDDFQNKVNKYECEIRKYTESCDDCNFCKMED